MSDKHSFIIHLERPRLHLQHSKVAGRPNERYIFNIFEYIALSILKRFYRIL